MFATGDTPAHFVRHIFYSDKNERRYRKDGGGGWRPQAEMGKEDF